MPRVRTQPPVVWIEGCELERMVAEADQWFPLETGGVLAGYIRDGQYVVMQVIGPGPGADHESMRFEPDHEWQCRELDRIFADTAGVCSYLGDWHTHPLGVTNLSPLDCRTLAKIAASVEARAPQPLMIIGAGEPSHWLWAAHLRLGGRLGRLLPRVIECKPRTFRS